MKKVLQILLLIITIISLALIIKSAIEPANIALIKDKNRIENIINKKYSSYIIKNLELNYVDWSSTVTSADENHKATEAKVILQNESEQITIYLKKVFLKLFLC